MRDGLACWLCVLVLVGCPTPSGVNDAGGGEPPSDDAGQDDGDGRAPDTWTVLPAIEAGPRQEIGVVALGREVFVVGGYSGSVFGNTLLAYDVDTQRWRQAADVPAPVHHPNVAVWEGRLFLLGSLGSGFAASGLSWVYEPLSDTWSSLAPMPSGTERGAAVALSPAGSIWIVGGFRGGAVPTVSVYDPEEDGWSEGPTLPEALDHAFGGQFEGRLVITGGRDGGLQALSDTTYVLDPGEDSWSVGAPMPTARAGGAFAVIGQVLLTFGGEGNLLAPSGVFDDVEAYDVVEDSWALLSPMPVPRHGLAAARIDDRVFLPGGAEVQAFGAVDYFDAFRAR